MTPTSPRAFFLGETRLVLDDPQDDPDKLPGVRSWLRHIGEDKAEAWLDRASGSDIEILKFIDYILIIKMYYLK